MRKEDIIKMGTEKWYESLKECVDAKCSSDDVRKMIDDVKFRLEAGRVEIAVLEKFLDYAEGVFKKRYADENDIAKEIDDAEDALFDELDAMHDN